MSIKLYLSGRLTSLAKGKDLLNVNGTTVAECLDDLVRLVPTMKQALFYESGRLVPQAKVLVNEESAGAEGFARKVNEGDEIYIEFKTH